MAFRKQSNSRAVEMALAIVVTIAASPSTRARSLTFDSIAPSTLFVQSGIAENSTQSYVLGLTWDWNWSRQYFFGTVTGYYEASFGRWTTEVGESRGTRWATQLGITPALRIHPPWLSRNWFVDIGVGANVILPIYRSKDKRFSTEFNFGDHIGLGWRPGESLKQEVVLRLQHFSNAGIDHPNPGENFYQLRYSRKF